jgi:hypothetical protein
MSESAPPKKRELLRAMFRKLGDVHAGQHELSVRVQHLEDCHTVLLDQQRDLLIELATARIERQKLAATNRMLIEHNMRLIAHGSAYLKALGMQAYMQIQARESRRLSAPSTAELTADELEHIARARREMDGA